MKQHIIKILFIIFAALPALLISTGANGDDSSPEAVAAPAEALVSAQDLPQAAIVAAPELPLADFLTQVFEAIKSFGGLPTVLKLALLISLLISSMKVTVLRTLIWDKLGAFKVWAAPILGLIAGLLGVYGEGDFSLAKAFAYMSAGAGAIIVHELLDSVKALPKIGKVYVTIIELIQKALKVKK